MKIKIDRRMLPMKAHYFFNNAGTAPVVPFMPTFARQLGFSSVVVGTIYTVLPVVGMLVKPLFGAIADKFQKRKILFLAFQLLTALSFFGIKFIQPLEQTAQLDFHCNDGVSDLKFNPSVNNTLSPCLADELTRDRMDGSQDKLFQCTMSCLINEPWEAEAICQYWQNNRTGECDLKRTQFDLVANIKLGHIEYVNKSLLFLINDVHMVTAGSSVIDQVKCPKIANSTHYFRTKCEAKCTDRSVMQAIGNQRANETSVISSPQLWVFFTLMALSWAGMAAVVSLGDAICFQMLGDKHALYGNQRLWGAVGWGIFSVLAGLLVDEMSRGMVGYKDYSGVFYLMLVLIGVDLFVSWPIQDKQVAHSSNLVKDIGVLFLSPAICVFFVWCIVIGLGTALVWNFLFWHLEVLADAEADCSTTEWMKTLQGLAMGIQCFGGELPFFFVSGAILQRIGHIHAMSLVLLGFGVRFMLYSILTNPWWVLPIELMQGITFGIFYSTMTSYASLVAPPGTEATLQGLVGAIFEGIGVSIGSFIGGYAIDELGGSQTFRIFGAVALVLFVVHVVVQMMLVKCACIPDKGGRLQYSTPVDALTMLSDDDHYSDRT